ncbi:Predicted PurR-regulated permease PerM [Citreimonas salinaria]|uniref:Predicted PurR-regulated permease PerM n=2 Tax=Citreimonas salinaria TaxID=321339 RepID=A0A1H3NLT0_9RHOB|nr:Predicted PurR-regulated permease PerM [Citreimonas salinaria]
MWSLSGGRRNWSHDLVLMQMAPITSSRRAVSLAVILVSLLFLLIIAPDVLLVVFAGLLIAVFLDGGGTFIARHVGLARGWGIGIFILLLIGVLAAAVVAFAPAAVTQFNQLNEEIPSAIEELRGWIEQFAWGERLLDSANPAGLVSGGGGSAAATAVTSTFGALGNFIIMLFIGLYGALDPGSYRRGLVALLAPSVRERGDEVLGKAGSTLQNWLIAQLMAMTVVGVLTWLGLWLLGIPLAFILGLIAALLAFIPNIGPVLAAVPAILLALPEGGTTVLLVILVYLSVQTLESYFITPLIQQERVSLPPVLIISMQLLLGVLFGLLGLALATPLAALGMTLVREVYVGDYLEREDERKPGAG